MKKIKKVNRMSAQSVYSFYCPCDGSCEPNCSCTKPGLYLNTYKNDMSANNPHWQTQV